MRAAVVKHEDRLFGARSEGWRLETAGPERPEFLPAWLPACAVAVPSCPGALGLDTHTPASSRSSRVLFSYFILQILALSKKKITCHIKLTVHIWSTKY